MISILTSMKRYNWESRPAMSGIATCPASPSGSYTARVYGPYEPERGLRFNPHKLLIDPYAKWIAGRLVWSDAHFGYRTGSARADLSFDRRDNARGMPKCVVIDEAFTWGEERKPAVAW